MARDVASLEPELKLIKQPAFVAPDGPRATCSARRARSRSRSIRTRRRCLPTRRDRSASSREAPHGRRQPARVLAAGALRLTVAGPQGRAGGGPQAAAAPLTAPRVSRPRRGATIDRWNVRCHATPSSSRRPAAGDRAAGALARAGGDDPADRGRWASTRSGPATTSCTTWPTARPMRPGTPGRVLAAAAAITTRVALGPLVTPVGFYNPAVLAKKAATVDEISGGRLILGLGAGWNEVEFRGYGVPFDHRISRFEEAFTIIRTLLAGGRDRLRGHVLQRPRLPARAAVRPGGPPIMIGSVGERMLDITLPYVKSWNVWHTETRQQPGRRGAAAGPGGSRVRDGRPRPGHASRPRWWFWCGCPAASRAPPGRRHARQDSEPAPGPAGGRSPRSCAPMPAPASPRSSSSSTRSRSSPSKAWRPPWNFSIGARDARGNGRKTASPPRCDAMTAAWTTA